MTHISTQEIESDVRGVLERIRGGEEIILEEGGVPLCRVIPIQPRAVPSGVGLRLGLLEGQAIIPDNWKEIGMEDFYESIDRDKFK